MDAPELCLHKETQYKVERCPDSLKQRLCYFHYFVDWQPTADIGPFDSSLLAVECQVNTSWLADDRQADGTYGKMALWAIKLIYHTPIRRYRPLSYSKGPERLAQECRWQEGASFEPYGPGSAPCWERRLLYGFSHRILQAYPYGDSAIFDALETVWRRVFRRQYEFFLRLRCQSVR